MPTSGGAFDITIAPISWLWDFDENPRLPQAETIEALLPAVNYENVSLLEDGTAALQTHSTALDLGAVGKGAACDAAVDAYEEAGINRAVVSVGGSVGVYGEKPGGQPWTIALRDPDTEGSLGTLSLASGFLSTSGSYEKQFTEDGVTYHHLLDPDTGYPAESGCCPSPCGAAAEPQRRPLHRLLCAGHGGQLPVLEQFDSQALFITQERQIYLTSGLEDGVHFEFRDYTLAGTV